MRAITILFILLAHLGMAQVINLDPPVQRAVYSDTAKFALSGAGGGGVELDPIWIGDSSQYYPKLMLNSLLDNKLNVSDTASLSNRINTKLSISDTTNKWQPKGTYVITELDPVWISDSVDYYTKSSVNSLLSSKQSKSDTTTYDATKTYVNSQGFLKTTVLNANYVGVGSVTNTLTGSSNLTYNTTDGMYVNGDIKYKPPHGFYYCKNKTQVIAVATANVYKMITNATGDLFTVKESTDITYNKDSLTFTKAGDYEVHIAVSFEGGNDKAHYYIIHVNGVELDEPPVIQVGKGVGKQMSCSQMFYLEDMQIGDDMKVMVTTEDASDPTIISASIYVKKAH